MTGIVVASAASAASKEVTARRYTIFVSWLPQYLSRSSRL